jgi:glycosyltransferase involved in cell wall biosynthesis
MKRAYYRQIIRPACHRASYVLTVSEYSKREIAAWSGLNESKIINVGNGVGSPFTEDGPKHMPGYPYLLYVGSHKPHKNLPRLLKAYATSEVCNDVCLVLTGTPSNAMYSELRALRIENKVFFAGVTDNHDLARLYRGSLGFVFPSLYEGFGLPPLEAMACGTPVLTSNVCSLPEVVGNAAIQVDPVDVDAIAEGIRMLAMNSGLRSQLRQRGIMQAQKFTWQQTARRTEEVLRRALASD